MSSAHFVIPDLRLFRPEVFFYFFAAPSNPARRSRALINA